jgi:hypothetical protein
MDKDAIKAMLFCAIGYAAGCLVMFKIKKQDEELAFERGKIAGHVEYMINDIEIRCSKDEAE